MARIPFIARASGGSVTVRGGERLRKFISDFQGLSNERVAALMADILRSVVLPQLRARAPKRTGALVRSLKVVRRGSGIELRGLFYGRFTSVPGQPGKTVARLAMEIIEDNRDQIRERLKVAILRELGV